jgi:sensor histidine kinase YesM
LQTLKRLQLIFQFSLSENISNNTDIFIKLLDRVSIVLLNSPEVREQITILQDENINYFVKREAQEKLQLTSYSVTTTRDFFYISYYGKNGDLLYSTATIDGDNSNLFATTTLKENEKITNKILSPIDLNFTFYESDNPIAVIRSLINPSSGEINGYLMIFCDAKRIWNDDTAKVVSSIDVPLKYVQILKDSNNNLILSNIEDNIIIDDSYFLKQWKSDYTNWKVLVGINKADYYKLIFKSKIYGLIFPLIILVIITLFLMELLNRSLVPFNTLVKKMQGVALGDYSQRITEESWFSDIDLVLGGFNSMTEEIDKLVNTVYANEILYHKVQLEMLKLQMNPHFLFNTLQCIEAMGEINDIPQVSEISHLLGKILRYNLRERDIVSLKEEVDSLSDYLRIQKIRFEEKIFWKFNIESDVLALQIPKFILQPTIENCVVHSTNNYNNTVEISVTGYIKDNILILIVRDNGIGMSQFEIDKVNLQLRTSKIIESKEHIGLLNVNKRIQTRYGNEYGISLDSKINKYTKVTYQLPIIQKESVNV